MMRKLENHRAILFDLDGTLVDANPDIAEAARRMLAELGEPPRSDEEIGRFVGKGIGVLVERALNIGRREHTEAEIAAALERFITHYAAVNGQQATVYPHVREVLEGLRAQGVPMACVTNKAAVFTVPLLQKLGLSGFFACIVSGDTLPQKKPEPEPLLHSCRELGVAPAQAVMIGDSDNDALAARRAGIPVWLVRGGYSEGIAVDSIDCDGLLSSFADLPDLLAFSRSRVPT
ncbi:phosphoglycolate phosphatase [Uliginosibacterium sp. H3]|uniref:Phosphoglycolate phosphatase n=1 Tax=Uliginosibacterium silvisoli TaxID=3114758 RepID=A0ABU6K3H8_9RHOO|nr:phosphoglycolate phosphatase [Uliginosibacterium sp. H3]